MVLAFSVCAKKVDLKKRSVSLSFNFDTMPALFGQTDEVLPGGGVVYVLRIICGMLRSDSGVQPGCRRGTGLPFYGLLR